MSAERFTLLGFPTKAEDHVCTDACTEEAGHLVNPSTSIDFGEAETGLMVGMFIFHPGQGVIRYASFRASNFNDLNGGVAQSVLPRLASQLRKEIEKRARASALVASEPTLAAEGPVVPDSHSGSLVVASAADLRGMRR